MTVIFFDKTKFYIKASFCQMGDFMAMKNHFYKGKNHGHME